MDAKIKDVAQLAGVSISTVSNVLSGRKHVTPEKHAAVMDAVRQLGYVPNINARLLKSRHTGNIGLFLPYIDGIFYTSLLQEIYHACTDHGYALFTHVAWESDSQKTAATILSCNIDAAVILNDRLHDSEISTLAGRGLPLVFMDRQSCQTGVSSVVLDNADGTAQLVAYLRHTGHRRVAYLRGLNNYDGDERYAAFCSAMRAAQLPLHEELLMDGQFSRKVAYNCTYYMMRHQRTSPPDAILCANDEMAFGCIQALSDLGYAVPRDISVLGFDDMGAATCAPPLTTVGYSMHDFARTTVDEALRLIANPRQEGRKAVVKTELILRKSVEFRYDKVSVGETRFR